MLLWFFRLINTPPQCSQIENTLFGFMNYRVSLRVLLGNKGVTKSAEKHLIVTNQAEINNPCKTHKVGFVAF
jgi:hypothetical protein